MVLQAYGQSISISNVMVEFGKSNKPFSFSNLYNIASGVPASGVIGLSNMFLKAAGNNRNLVVPSDPAISVIATSITGKSAGNKIGAWNNYNYGTPLNSNTMPTYRTDSALSNMPYVEFTGSSYLYQYLKMTSNIAMNYGDGGGSTVLLLCRYKSPFVQDNRSISHNGGTGSSRALEWIMMNNGTSDAINVKYFFNAVEGVAGSTSNVPFGKWSLYVMRMTNSTGEMLMYRNNSVIGTRTGHPALTNSTPTDFYLGTSGGFGNTGQNMDLYYAGIYTRPLTDTELTNIYNSVSGICAN